MRQAAVAPIRPQPAPQPSRQPPRQEPPARIADARRRREVLEQFQEAARWKRTGSRSRTARLDADERAYERVLDVATTLRRPEGPVVTLIGRGTGAAR